ncbi:Sporulation and spore germination [Paenibacillus sp. UNCCL117]|uniref:GerMN domain-containing protein n=1 Tax=unclassified Paenibacillus TaxID=185978 RepID=UPI00088AB2A3|nr:MULTISPECIES: GerMN domain-containing protein [unclassified Paenibacillus]SDC42259.1 Sporulation and spore germination [Paenibacillus sp. cl123]SFW13293.1 Sporulation and spore germination [Paenibacillus sp. UNCCL117]
MQTHWCKMLTAAALFALVASGCGQKPAVQPNTPAPETPQSTGQASGSGGSSGQAGQPVQPVQPSKQSKSVKSYYADANLEKLLERETTIEFTADKDKYLAAFQELKKTPDDKSVSLAKNLTFKSATLKDGQLTLDLVMPAEARLGAGGEEMLLTALQKTAFQFEEVKTLEILLEGKQVESLMGHMELQHPFKR